MTSMILQGNDTPVTPNESANFGLEGYKSFGSFNPIYREVWPKLISCYPVPDARKIFFVLLGHIMHANEIGMHFAGVDQIAAVACYSDTSVQRAELVLAELEWVKMHWIKDPTQPSGKPHPRYQVSPHVAIWIAPPFIESALHWWSLAVPFRRSSRRNVIIKVQPESEPDSGTRINNQNHNQQYKPEQNFSDGEEQTRKRQQPNKSSAKAHPGECDLESCRQPLTEPRDESLAQAIAKQYRTHTPQARQLVKSYGAAAVTQAIDAMLIEAQNGLVIAKPAGYLRNQLRQGAAGVPSLTPATPTGKYSDFFQK